MKTVFAVLACAFTTVAFAVPPPPQVTVAATDVRQLEFNWDPVPGNGGVVVHQRKASGWEIHRLVKPGSHQQGLAGYSIALGDNGKVLAVGAPYDASAAAGIDGDRDDTSVPQRGAVWLY